MLKVILTKIGKIENLLGPDLGKTIVRDFLRPTPHSLSSSNESAP